MAMWAGNITYTVVVAMSPVKKSKRKNCTLSKLKMDCGCLKMWLLVC